MKKTLKRMGATQDLTFMFWIIANDCACVMIFFIQQCLIHKQIELWGITSTSSHIKSKQYTFPLML